MMKNYKRFWISGRVQGVWYRAWTQQQAQKLQILGYAHNLPDGRVEVLACGEEDTLIQLQQLLWQGPVHARVADIQVEHLAYHEVLELLELSKTPDLFADFTVA